MQTDKRPPKGLHVGMVSTFPPGTGSLNEYAFHFVRHLVKKPEVGHVTLFVDDLPTDDTTHQQPASDCNHPPKQYSVEVFDRVDADSHGADPESLSNSGQHRATLSFVPCWAFNKLSSIWRMIRAIRSAKPDVVIFNIQFASFGDTKLPATLGLMTPALLRYLKIPTIVLTHNIMETVDLKSAGFVENPIIEKILRTAGWLVTHILLKANLVAVTIPKYVEILEERYKAINVVLAPHGSFNDIAETPSFELPDGPLQIMSFGKFGTYKKVETLIEAFDILQKTRNQPLELVIAGTNSPNATGYLEEVAEAYKHVENIRYTGYVAEEDVPQIFGDAAVVVFPYTSTTGSSGVLHQSGEYGKAVILPKIGDLAELIAEEGYTGEFFTPNDSQSLTDALQRIIDDPAHRIALGQQNYLAAHSLSLNDVVDWYLLHAETLIAPKSNNYRQSEILAHS